VVEPLELTKAELLARRELVAVARLARLAEIMLAQMERQILEVVGVALHIKLAQPRHLEMVALEL
jgi:hypothetical protein